MPVKLVSEGKESACSSGDLSSIPGSERSPGGGNGNPPQYSCLGNPTDRAAWPATVQEVAKQSEMTEQLSTMMINAAIGEALHLPRTKPGTMEPGS